MLTVKNYCSCSVNFWPRLYNIKGLFHETLALTEYSVCSMYCYVVSYSRVVLMLPEKDDEGRQVLITRPGDCCSSHILHCTPPFRFSSACLLSQERLEVTVIKGQEVVQCTGYSRECMMQF